MIEPGFSLYTVFFLALLTLPLWYIRMTRGILFYLYLWQLKEYHIGRFIDHFRTGKGKSLIVNKIVLVKLVLLIVTVPALVLVLYGLEAAKAFYDIWRKQLRGPVRTQKTLVLLVVSLGALTFLSSVFFLALGEGLFSLSGFARTVLAIDLLTPVIVSAIVLGLQPFTVLARKRILQQAREKRKGFPNLKVIGITGSYGKTSTKEFLTHILSQKFQVLKTPEHQNSEVGVANTILRSLTDEHDIFVCEMGAYNKGGIKILADITKPDVGIVTGVNEQHLATFGSMENLLSAEGGEELIRALPKHGVAIINGGSEKLRNHMPNLKKANPDVRWIGTTEDIVAQGLKVEKERVSFTVQKTRFEVPTHGGHNSENLLLAIAAANEMGMSLEEIAQACSNMSAELSAMKLRQGKGGLRIIDSIYSANPDGVIADLEYLKLWEGKKIIVMPCLIELGKASKEVHKRIGEKIADICDLAIITTRECFEDVKEGAKGKEVLFLENSHEILGKIEELTKNSEGAVLLEGGKESRVQRQLIHSLTV